MLQQLLFAVGDIQQLQAQIHHLRAEQDSGEDEWEEAQQVVGFQPYATALQLWKYQRN